jgi:hypothetical protein
MLNVSPLYRVQNLHLFHGQLRVTRSSRLADSLGGRLGPNLETPGLFRFAHNAPHRFVFINNTRDCGFLQQYYAA